MSFYNITASGGAEYFGITDTAGFSSITILDSPGNDYWALDDVTYNTASVAATPEPSSLLLLTTGLLGGAALAGRKRKMAVAS